MIFSTGGIKGRTSRGLALALELALLASPAFAAVYTLPTTVTSTAYVDLGAGPLDIGVNSVNGVSIVVADSLPTAGTVGNVVLGKADKITFCQMAHIYAEAFNGTATVTATPTSCAGGGGGGSSAIATWAGSTLGAISNYGTSPGAVLVPGVNAYVTNFPASWTLAGGSATIGNVNQSAATAGFSRITDGTRAAAVTAASTAPAATDPAVVVALSPNGALPAFAATPTVNLGTLNGAATAANQTAPQAATGSAAPANAMQAGAVSSGNLVGIIQGDTTTNINVTTTTTGTALVNGVTGKKIYVTHYEFLAGGTTTFSFGWSTSTSCTSITTIAGPWSLTAQSGLAPGSGLGPEIVVPSGDTLCVVSTGSSVQVGGHLTFTQF